MDSTEGQAGADDSRGAARGAGGGRVAMTHAGRGWLILSLVVALYVAARVWRLDAACLWFDEIFGLHAARHGWGDLARFVALDLIHPPLFYALLKIWAAAGGESVWWLRLFGVAASTLALVPVALLGRELRLGRRTVPLALALAASSGYLIKYAREVRMYAPLLLFAACSLWLFARLCNGEEAGGGRRRGATLALACANLLLAYTHYFGWLLIGLELAFLLAWHRRLAPRFAAWALGLNALLFAPWAWALWRATGTGGGVAQNIGWAARPRLHEIFLPYLLLHEPFRFQQHSHEPVVLRLSVALALVVFAPPLVALAWRTFARGRRGGKGASSASDSRDGFEALSDSCEGFAVRFLVFFSIAPVVVTFALAHALPHSVWGTRHLIVIAPAYLLLAAHAVVSLRPGWLAACVCTLLGCWLALAAALFVTRRHVPPVWCAWGTLARAVGRDADDAARPGDDATRPGDDAPRRGDDAARAGGDAVQRDDGATRPGNDATRRGNGAAEGDDGAARRGDNAGASPREGIKVYAFEDLVAYHLWHEGGGAGGAFEVAVVRGVPGAAEDRAFFLPRGFDGVSVVDYRSAFGEEHFWLAFRAAAWDESHPALKSLAGRGYAFGRRHEMSSQGQTAFMVPAVRR